MRSSSDLVDLDLEMPDGWEAGSRHSARILAARRIVPSTILGFDSVEVGSAHPQSFSGRLS